MEIGSFYELDPRIAKETVPEELKPVPEETLKYKKRFVRYTASGREAIALALRALEEYMPDIKKVCLLPAYMCDAVFRPFILAGWELHFYHIGIQLRADGEQLERLLKQYRPGLLLIHPYYGTDTWEGLRPVLAGWRKKGLILMEDVTQSYYLPQAGREADFVVGSLRKWYAVPDGGFTAADIPLPEAACSQEQFTGRRLRLLTAKWDYLYGRRDSGEKAALKERFLKENWRLEEELDSVSGIHGMSAQAIRIMQFYHEKSAADQRKENCRILAEGLYGMNGLSSPVNVPGGDAAPLYYPVYVKERAGLQKWLSRHGIFAPVLWPVGKENADCLTEDEKYIFAHLLALPMDQRYGRPEMEKTVETVREYDDRNQGGCQ